MLLYELTSPVELKYGGSLTEEQSTRCTRQTELNSPRWTPYPPRTPQVENICGKFVVRVAGGTATERGGGSVEEGSGATSSASGEGESGKGENKIGNTIEISMGNTIEISMGNTIENKIDNEIEIENQNESQIEREINSTKPTVYTSCLNNRQVAVDQRLSSVCFKTDSPFGKQREIFHIDGHITVRCTPGLPKSMIFKGAKGVESITRLIRDLILDQEKTVALVHMGVISSCMGVRLQTSQCCYLENRVNEGVGTMRGGWMTVEARSPDQCNIVRLSVKDWTGLLLPSIIPISNDIVITGKGSVIHRFSWVGLPWDEHVERDVLGACESVVEAISSVC